MSRRSRAALATTSPWASPSTSFRNRVSILPRTGSVATLRTGHGSRDGKVSCSNHARRGDDERTISDSRFLGDNPPSNEQDIARIRARERAGDPGAGRQFDRHVLEGVHDDIRFAAEQSLRQVRCEGAAIAHLPQRRCQVPVTGRRARQAFDVDARVSLGERTAHQRGLQTREGTAPTEDPHAHRSCHPDGLSLARVTKACAHRRIAALAAAACRSVACSAAFNSA